MSFGGIRLIPPGYDGAPFLRFELGEDEDAPGQRVERAVERAMAIYEAAVGESADAAFMPSRGDARTSGWSSSCSLPRHALR